MAEQKPSQEPFTLIPSVRRPDEGFDLYQKPETIQIIDLFFTITVFTLLIFSLYFFYLELWPAFGVLISSLLLSIFARALYLKGKSITLSINLVMFASVFAITCVGFIYEGIHSPACIWFSCSLLFSYYLIDNKYFHYFWIGYLILLSVVLAYPEPFHVKIGHFSNPSHYTTVTLLCVILNIVFIYVITSMYKQFAISLYRKEEDKSHQLTELLQEHTRLLRVLSHDIANSITVIQLSAQRAKEDSGQTERHLQAIENCTDNITKLITHLRDQQAILSGKKKLQLEKINLVEIAHKAVSMLSNIAENKKIQLEISANCHECYVWAEPTSLLNVVILNLLINGIKFSPPDSKILLKIIPAQDSVKFLVIDQGLGIPSSILPHLFSFGAKTSRRGTAGEKGTGFGMPLAKTYVEKFGGKIEVESQVKTESHPQSGTQFTVTLKAA